MSQQPARPPVIIVTGASRGIGAAVARQAATGGYAVVVNYARDVDGAEAVVAEITTAGGLSQAVQADVADPGQLSRLIDAAAELGELCALVNNAAITGNSPGTFVELPDHLLAETFATNVLGSMRASQAVLQHWQRSPASRMSIINISSTATKAGSPGEWVHYAATKGAIDVFTRGLAAEVAQQGIRVNAVAPGLTDTGLHQEAGMPDRVARLSPTIPMGRAATPEEVANAVLWLLSDQASYITGSILPVSGGR
ncbi:SDR family NAD(P)-dependent oxidoreductase [Psychromicrobium lacuslunae]|uniref:Oxidoreductase n=1 Tax=Psychromicrobium lacuslunae TaxID=1618207 RepID=A0A0D4BX90_9MICC|nr:SDR family oxidoreductase [Psychromicrobium lacuslunae]AJT40731.1 oxidoreductase [Psychromicrobium lacuslunae]